jgi:hypothetical protein
VCVGAAVEPVEGGIEEREPSAMQPQPVPHPVASMNPLSNVDTTAAARGTSAPLRLIRMRSLRGSVGALGYGFSVPF